MLALRRVVVVEAGDPAEPLQRLTIELAGERRPARADIALVGASEAGDEVIVNVAARDLGLGSGGFDVVHVNLTRGLEGSGTAGAHVMKLNYTSLQHAVLPVEEGEGDDERPAPQPVAGPVGVLFLHGQLAPACWALGAARAGARVGYVQGAGGALPGGLSDVVRELRGRDLLHRHVTAAPAYGGEREAITVAEALHWGLTADGWDAALCAPGPGILGSASAYGHGGMAALDAAHAALGLGAPTLLVPRMSSGDPRARHRGLSHHARTVLGLALVPLSVALPEGEDVALPGPHEPRHAAVDLDGYRASGLPSRTMGRTIDEDPLFFASALAGGTALAAMIA